MSIPKSNKLPSYGRIVPLVLFAILLFTHSAQSSADANEACHFVDWLKVHEKYSSPNHSKTYPERDAAISNLEARINAGHLDAEWSRLIKEAEATPNGKSEGVLAARMLLATIFFEKAVRSKDLPLARSILSMEKLGYVRPLIEPEFFLVREGGTSAFHIIFQAYKEAKNWETKTKLAAMVRRAFFYNFDDTWAKLDTDDVVVIKAERWFSSVESDLRPVEIYWPVSGNRFYFEQGIKSNERLIGLFFLK